MSTSTARQPIWRRVEKGAHISLPCEGGFVGKVAEEDGILFELEGQDGMFIPKSMAEAAMAALVGVAPRKEKAR